MNADSMHIPIIGLACAGGDAHAVEKALGRVPHVREAYVNPVTETAYLHVEGSHFEPMDAVRVIEEFGLTPILPGLTPTVASSDPIRALLEGHLPPQADGSDEDRVVRIASEASQAFRSLAHVRRAVAVFGSARSGPAERWGALARDTSAALSEAGFAVITGGGPGLMERSNAGAAEAGGPSVGLTIELPREQGVNPYVDLHVPFHYFFLRKLAFIKYACAFVFLPGGYGTLDELFEALNLSVTGTIEAFPLLLIGADYWSGLVDWMRSTCVANGALSDTDLELIEITDDPARVVARVTECHAGLCHRVGIDIER